MHHPLYRPIVLNIWLCVVIIGLNVLALWWLQPRIPAPPVASTQADRTPVRLEPPPTVAPCEPTVAVNETQIAEQDAVISRLEAEVERMKSARVGKGSEWREKAEQLEQDLVTLQQVAERVLELPPQNWQVGKLMLAHALVKEKT
jgi:hypothetical protein